MNVDDVTTTTSLQMMSSLGPSNEPSLFLVRILFLRAMALVHMVAFTVALRQNKALIGDEGITPARFVLLEAQERGRRKKERRLQWRASVDHDSRPIWGKIGAFIDARPSLVRLRELLWDRSDAMDRPVTTLLWFAKDKSRLDPWLDGIAKVGLALSSLVLFRGAANVPVILGMWLCQRSLMAVGGCFYGYGWEPQLAELSFHALFLVPFLSLNPIPNMPVPKVVSWTIRWYLFRIMMGAGLIKIKSADRKWKDLTAMDFFYETQPVPNPLTRYFHWMPKWWHKGEVLINHMVELVAPWLLILPGLPLAWRRAGGVIQIAFQAILISSGNLSFLNWLTAVPAIMALDDAFVERLFSQSTRTAAVVATWTGASLSSIRKMITWSFLALVVGLSIPVVRNLVSRRQIMNSSFDPLRLINSYGAFGSVSEERDEFIISAAPSFDGPWKEYEFPVKPGDPYKKPRFISPYHYRLDWQMWIAAVCRSLDRSPWIFRFLLKLLQQDPQVLALLANDPWKVSTEKPKYIRIDVYRYKFHVPEAGETKPPYWDRQFTGRLYPRQGIATVEDLKEEIKARLPRRPL